MCVGVPMQVTAVEPGWAQCVGRGEQRRVRTALIDPPQIGDWLLVHLDSAIEAISAQRAAEVDAALDWVAAAMQGQAAPGLAATTTPLFSLPSAMSAEHLAQLTGQSNPAHPSALTDLSASTASSVSPLSTAPTP